MLLLRTLAPWLLLALLVQQVSLTSGARAKNRGATAAPGRGQRPRGRSAEGRAGKFLNGLILCTWRARDVGDAVRLSVNCDRSRTCRYTARPQSCPGYLSNSRGFWRQVARAFETLQDKVCTDERALVTGMCKRAPQSSHFRLDRVRPVTSEVTRAPPLPPRSTSAATTACTGRADHRRAAEEYCSEGWASVCSFLFSVLQSDC